MVIATLSGIIRGQRDLAAFAAKLTQRQLRALNSYQKRDGTYDFPKETTFQRILAQLDPDALERILFQWEDRLLGEHIRQSDPLIAIDGKAQRGSTPHVPDEQKALLVSAQSLPSGRVLGTVAVDLKTNEIPAARQLLEKLGPLDGKLVMLDALHTCQETIRQIHQENGADYLLPVKDNHKTLADLAAACLPPPDSPSSIVKAKEKSPPTPTPPSPSLQLKAELPPLRTKPAACASTSSPSTPAPAVRYRRQRRP
jgi:hypothetical protein